jgi:hypothetical protein
MNTNLNSFERRITAAVEKAKAAMAAAPIPSLTQADDPTPDYYKIPGTGLDAMTLIEALRLNFTMGCIFKYAIRAGRKTKNPLQDLRKAQVCLAREIARLEAAGVDDGGDGGGPSYARR